MTCEEFIKSIVDAKLLDETDLRSEHRALGKDASAVELGKQLDRIGKLSPYQVDNILNGQAMGLVCGDFVILDAIGRGGEGRVFKAKNRFSNVHVALKILLEEDTQSAEKIQRFRNEIEALRRLEKENGVTVIHSGVAERHFFAMTYLDGYDLQTILNSQKLSVAQALDYVGQAAVLLGKAHTERIIHRDIKPGNLFLDGKGSIRLLDFGCAFVDNVETTLAGTAGYIAPECYFSPRTVDHKIDIFSLGCCLHIMITGELPFRQTINACDFADLPSVCQKNPEVVPEMDGLLKRMLAIDPKNRIPTMMEVAQEIAKIRKAKYSPKANRTIDKTVWIARWVGIMLVTAAILSGIYRLTSPRIGSVNMQAVWHVLPDLLTQFEPPDMSLPPEAQQIVSQLRLIESDMLYPVPKHFSAKTRRTALETQRNANKCDNSVLPRALFVFSVDNCGERNILKIWPRSSLKGRWAVGAITRPASQNLLESAEFFDERTSKPVEIPLSIGQNCVCMIIAPLDQPAEAFMAAADNASLNELVHLLIESGH